MSLIGHLIIAIALGMVGLLTLILLFRDSWREKNDIQHYWAKDSVFKYNLDTDNFEFFGHTFIFKNKKIISREELMGFVVKNKEEFSHQLNIFLTTIARNGFLFKLSSFEAIFNEPHSKTAIKYKLIFNLKDQHILYGELKKSYSTVEKLESPIKNIHTTYKQFETSLLTDKSSTTQPFYIYTISPTGMSVIEKTYDEKTSRYVCLQTYNKLQRFYKSNKHIYFYADNSNRLTVALRCKSLHDFKRHMKKIMKIISSPVHLNKSSYYLLAKIGVTNIQEQITETIIKKSVLKNIFSIEKINKLEKSDVYYFRDDNEVEFNEFIETVDQLSKLIIDNITNISYKPYYYVKSSKVVGYDAFPKIESANQRQPDIYELYRIAARVQMIDQLFVHLNEKIILDFFMGDKHNHAVLFLPIPLSHIEKFISLQNELKTRIDFDKNRVVIKVFDYEYAPFLEQIHCSKMIKENGYKLGFVDITADDFLPHIEACDPTFYFMDRSLATLAHKDVYAMLRIKSLRKMCNEKSAFLVSSNVDNQSILIKLMELGVDLIYGDYFLSQQINIVSPIKESIPIEIKNIREKINYM